MRLHLNCSTARGSNAVCASIGHQCTQMQREAQVPPLPIMRGEGSWLFDDIGRRYFDTSSSWWVNLFGHSDARLNAALKEQLDTLPHVMLAGCTHAPAVEMALNMSSHHWRNRGHQSKREFAGLRQGYHGETLGALAVTDVAVFHDAYVPLRMHWHQVMSPDAHGFGVLGAMEIGYQPSKIQEERMHYEMLKHTGEYPIVGFSTFRRPKGNAVTEQIELTRKADEEIQSRLARLAVSHTAHCAEALVMLAHLPQTAIDNGNMFEVLTDAVRVCSLGQITSTLFEVGGQYRRSM